MQETVEDGPFFCFQGADSEVNLAKIIQEEVTFAKRKLNLLFTFAIYPPSFTYLEKVSF